MARLECVLELFLCDGLGPESILVFQSMFTREFGRFFGCTREHLQKLLEFFLVVVPPWRKLPKYRTKLLTEKQHARSEKVCEGRLHVDQLFHVGDVFWSFH